VGAAAQLACLLEVSAEKPGNVTPTRSFGDMRYEDFLRSSVAIGPELARAGQRPVGETIRAAIVATRRWSQANTNLGIVLLFAPLAKAALSEGPGGLRDNLRQLLRQLTIEDARAAYAAIRLTSPGGLEQAVEHDVRTEPEVTLRQAMAGAVERDSIAAEYLSDYGVTFERGLPALQANLAQEITTDQAVLQTYLELLAETPDTLISRKQGLAAAQAVSNQAAQVIAAGGVCTPGGRQAIEALDARLRAAPGNGLNPGTTADLMAATLFVALLEGVLT
jgi:triphosphoribosyl-dephospho-CoA synthase